MQPLKTLSHTLRSRIQRAIDTMSNSPMAWGIILLMVALCLLPFLLLEKPGVTLQQLMPFIALCILPIVVAAWLRARAGAIIACLLIASGLFLISLFFHGFA